MMKLRKNLLVGAFAVVLAFASVACGGGGGAEEGGVDTGATEGAGAATEMAS